MKTLIERFKALRPVKAIGFNRVVLTLVLILLCLLFQALSSLVNHGSVFLTYERLISAVNYGYFIGFMALGVTFVIATGGIDFSIGSVMFAAGLISGTPPSPARRMTEGLLQQGQIPSVSPMG